MKITRVLRVCGALPAVKFANRMLRALTAAGHRAQLAMQWGSEPNPEWFDHFIDQHYGWTATRIPFGWERGIFNLLAIETGASVLELCCGDGFNAHHFYSIRAGKVCSVDFDPTAITHARKHFKAPNVSYEIADIRTSMPSGQFDNVIWDAAIEHFREAEMAQILSSIRNRLKPGGILSGYTLIEGEHQAHHEHEYEFKSREDLARVLRPHFRNVLVWQTDYPTRKNLYFFASDGALPFEEGWTGHTRAREVQATDV